MAFLHKLIDTARSNFNRSKLTVARWQKQCRQEIHGLMDPPTAPEIGKYSLLSEETHVNIKLRKFVTRVKKGSKYSQYFIQRKPCFTIYTMTFIYVAIFGFVLFFSTITTNVQIFTLNFTFIINVLYSSMPFLRLKSFC